MVHVPYKGGGPAVAALVQGEVDLFAGGASLLIPHVKSGQVKMIAVTEASRSPIFPTIPSVSELVPGCEVSNWFGVFARRGVPAPIVAQLNAEVNRVMETPAITARLRSSGMMTKSLSQLELAAELEGEHKRWSALVTRLKITAE